MEQIYKIFNMVFFALMIIVNAMAEYVPLGVGSTGEISAKYPNLFTPSPITFAIWLIIYIMVGVFAFFQLDLGGDSYAAKQLASTLGIWFVLSCVMNIGWMISWHSDVIWLALVFMLGLLISLIVISARLKTIENPGCTQAVINTGFNLYLGWICAATIANISVFLVKIDWNRFGLSEQFWTVIAVVLGAALGILFLLVSRNYAAALGIIWAYCGILIKHVSQRGYAGMYPAIITMVLISIAAIVACGIASIVLEKEAF